MGGRETPRLHILTFTYNYFTPVCFSISHVRPGLCPVFFLNDGSQGGVRTSARDSRPCTPDLHETVALITFIGVGVTAKSCNASHSFSAERSESKDTQDPPNHHRRPFVASSWHQGGQIEQPPGPAQW